VVDPNDWNRRRLRSRLAELLAERRDLVRRLLVNTQDRESVEHDLELIARG
jgi:hypothetical protein